MARAGGSERGRRFIAERIETHQQTFGYKSMWSHEFMYPTWVEDPAPIIEAIRGYVATDYDYAVEPRGGPRRPGGAPSARSWRASDGRGPRQAARRARAVAEHEPAHARPPLLRRPGHERAPAPRRDRDRPQARDAGALEDPEDVVFLRYNELRRADRRRTRGVRRAGHRLRAPRRARGGVRAAAARRGWARPPTRRSSTPTLACGGSPRIFNAGEPATTGDINGLGASPGVVEGPARVVSSLEEFDEVEEGEILVCRMTNPAWVVLFTKIEGW